jgi:hypothetical protein
MAPCILTLDTRLRWVVSFTPLLLYSRVKITCYPWGRNVGELTLSGRGGEEKNSYSFRESNPDCLAPSLVTMLTKL